MRPFPLQSHGGDEYVFVDWRFLPKDRTYNTAAWDKLDPMVGDQIVNSVAQDPEGIAKLRSLWTKWHGRAPDRQTNGQITWDLTQFIERRQIVVLRRVPVKVPQIVNTPPAYVPPPPPPKAAPPLDYEWRIECEHHKKAKRDLIVVQNAIQIVPSQGNIEEQVKIHLREKKNRGTPPTLKLSTGEDVKKDGADRGFDLYPFKAKWNGKVINNFLPIPFWNEYSRVDTYDVSGGPSGLRVEVYHPYRHKVEMKLPACKKYKTGAKLGEVAAAAKTMVTGHPIVGAGQLGGAFTPDPKNKPWNKSNLDLKKVEKFAYSRDNKKIQIPIFEAIGTIIKLANDVNQVIASVQEAVPKIGWYVEAGFKVFEGALAVEWYWKEHTDQRVFQYVDIAAQMTLFGCSLEIGFGLKLGFKAQAYLLFEGEVNAGVDACRGDPDAQLTLRVPYGGSIKGSVGFRVEAGNWVRADAHGESSFALNGDIALNRSPKEMLSIDGKLAWSGLTAVISASLGPEGCAGSYQYKGTLMNPMDIGSFHWPSDTKYEPPTMSKGAMAVVLEDVITHGTDVRVRGASSWDAKKIAEKLADRMDRHDTFLRTQKSVEGIAHSIRQDLDEIVQTSGERNWTLLKAIPEPIFLAYVDDPSPASKIQRHLDTAPTQNPINATI
jgi:hypothetical protein